MTKIRIMSDLHLEFGSLNLEPIGEDVLALIGDVGIYTQGAEWAIKYARRTGVSIVMIAGNHEFYRRPGKRGFSNHTIRSTLDALGRLGDSGLFTFLEDDIARVAGVLFVGCTLWTDYRLNGDAATNKMCAALSMNDHRMIYEDDHTFTTDDALKRHEFSVGLLRERLPRNYIDAPLIVMTHHLPSARSVSSEYTNDRLNAAYASNLDSLVADSGAALWVHGHTHTSCDYWIGDTRVLCNPRGYTPHGLNPSFDINLVIEVPV